MARRAFRAGAAAIRLARLTTWFQFVPTEVTSGTSTGGSLIFTLNAAALALRPFTIVRSHFEFWLRSDQEAAMEEQSVAVGLAIVSDDAVAVGVTAVPAPRANAASNLWFLHQFIHADESKLVDKVRPETRISVDSKAMRKVEVGQDLVVVMQGGAIGGGFTLGVAGRMLIKNN